MTLRRHTSGSPLLVTAFGETRTPREWLHHPKCALAKETTLTGRIRGGWSPERAITTPVAQRSPTLLLSAFGKRMTLTAWAAQPECTVTALTVTSRLKRGWPPERAITQPTSARLGSTPVTIDGQTKTVREWTRTAICTVSYKTVLRRLRNGMNPRTALTAPSSRKAQADR